MLLRQFTLHQVLEPIMGVELIFILSPKMSEQPASNSIKPLFKLGNGYELG